MITVAETGPFQKKVGRLLSENENEKDELIAYLSMNPNAGGVNSRNWRHKKVKVGA